MFLIARCNTVLHRTTVQNVSRRARLLARSRRRREIILAGTIIKRTVYFTRRISIRVAACLTSRARKALSALRRATIIPEESRGMTFEPAVIAFIAMNKGIISSSRYRTRAIV
jgi:hypothetical protein